MSLAFRTAIGHGLRVAGEDIIRKDLRSSKDLIGVTASAVNICSNPLAERVPIQSIDLPKE